MRRFEGILSEKREAYLEAIKDMTIEEQDKFDKQHAELLSESTTEIPHVNMTADEILKQSGYIDRTDFFISHGVKLDDLQIKRKKL